MPLVIMHPDGLGRTAVDYAYQLERPRSADLMLDMLESYDDTTFSKMLTDSVPDIIRECSDLGLKFLNSLLYQPIIMQEPIVVDWPTDMQEYVFTSHTSMISQKMIKNELSKILGKEDVEEE